MKRLIIIPLLLISILTFATNYYVKTGGSDAAAGTSDGAAWETITKVNTVWNAGTFASGDSILFNRGNTFYGKLIVKESGSAGSPIVIGSYGTGDDPIITGFTTITDWTDEGDNIWESTDAESTLTSTNLVTVNDVNTAMGRYPNVLSEATPAYQNLLFYSERLDVVGLAVGSPWGVFPNATITANQDTSVTGELTMELFTTVASTARIYQTATVTAGVEYTVSWDARRGTKSTLQYSVWDVTHSAYIVDPYNYTASVGTGHPARVTLTFTPTAGCTSVQINFTGNDGDFTMGTWYLGRVQMTDRAASYIATEGSVGEYSEYAFYETYVTNTTITSAALNDDIIDWDGATVVIKKYRWIIDRNVITDHTNSTLTYTPTSSYYGHDGWGYFIQNDLRCLDVPGEWYYDPSTKKLSVYATSEPTNLKIATIDTLVYINGYNYITFDNILFTGSNKASIQLTNSQYITVQNCSFNFSGYNAINGASTGNSSHFTLENSTIDNTNNNAISLPSAFDYATIRNNVITNTAMLPGMGGDGDDTYTAILTPYVDHLLIEYNTITNTGYNGIHFPGFAYGSNSYDTVRYNFVNYFNMTKDDGAGIYTHTAGIGKDISYNVVLNGVGNKKGLGGSFSAVYEAMGIYLDRNYNTSGNTVRNNTVAHIANAGIFLNGTHDNVITNNTVYDCTLASFRMSSGEGTDTVSNIQISDNKFIAKDLLELVFFANPWESLGPLDALVSDDNYWARPISDDTCFVVEYTSPVWSWDYMTLAQWHTESDQDANSHKNLGTVVSDTADIHFIYNETITPKTFVLSAEMEDVTGKSYLNLISIPAYSGIVLMGEGTVKRLMFMKNNGKFIKYNGKFVITTQ